MDVGWHSSGWGWGQVSVRSWAFRFQNIREFSLTNRPILLLLLLLLLLLFLLLPSSSSSSLLLLLHFFSFFTSSSSSSLLHLLHFFFASSSSSSSSSSSATSSNTTTLHAVFSSALCHSRLFWLRQVGSTFSLVASSYHLLTCLSIYSLVVLWFLHPYGSDR